MLFRYTELGATDKGLLLVLAVSRTNKKIYLEIIPSERSTKSISKKVFSPRDKGSYAPLHFNCKSIKPLDIDIVALYLSLGKRAVATTLDPNVLY